MKKVLVGLILFFVSVVGVLAYTSPGKPTGYINDFANILTSETKQQLENRLNSLDASTSAQIAVVVVKDLGGDNIVNYAEKLFNDWGIGQKGKDNGVLFLVAVGDRKVRIEVGYGLEGALTDAESSWIIRDKITPRFKEGNYNQGVIDGVEGIISAAAEDLQPSDTYEIKVEKEIEKTIGVIFWVVPLLLWFVSVLARSKSWWLGGAVGALLGGLIGGIKGLMIAGLIGLVFDYLVSKQYKQSSMTGSYPWWIGGKSGFGGGGKSGGFGGFRGGRSGGGGSSGGW